MAGMVPEDAGTTLPEPEPPAPTQANCPNLADKNKLRVFISYSRDDLDFADQLEAALDGCGFDPVIDRHGIPGGAEWEKRLSELIRQADTVAFVLSPASAVSHVCSWEVEESARLGKRILPVICRPLGEAKPPPRLRALNYIFFYAERAKPGSGFGAGLKELITALNTDFEWLRGHTRYLERATEWDEGGRPAIRLLSGADIAEAKTWAARRPKTAPEPTSLQLDFIRASEREAEARTSAERQQLEAIAAAQAEREKALREAETAVKLAADEQRKRANLAKIRNILLIFALVFAAAAGVAAWQARQERNEAEAQRNEAEAQRNQADAILDDATTIIASVKDKLDDSGRQMASQLFQSGAEHGSPNAMSNLGVSFRDGLGVAQDYAKAREWFEKAAGKGEASAMTNLGWLYANGKGVAQDYAKAREWYEKAAGKGDASAMRNLGLLYANGNGRGAGLCQGARMVRKGRRQGRGERHDQPRLALRQRQWAWRGTTPRRANGTKRPPTRARRAP